jgi:hypothetical protein
LYLFSAIYPLCQPFSATFFVFLSYSVPVPLL